MRRYAVPATRIGRQRKAFRTAVRHARRGDLELATRAADRAQDWHPLSREQETKLAKLLRMWFENPTRYSPRARTFISRTISRLVREGYGQPRAIAAAHSMARRAGYAVPSPRRTNPCRRTPAACPNPSHGHGRARARAVRNPILQTVTLAGLNPPRVVYVVRDRISGQDLATAPTAEAARRVLESWEKHYGKGRLTIYQEAARFNTGSRKRSSFRRTATGWNPPQPTVRRVVSALARMGDFTVADVRRVVESLGERPFVHEWLPFLLSIGVVAKASAARGLFTVTPLGQSELARRRGAFSFYRNATNPPPKGVHVWMMIPKRGGGAPGLKGTFQEALNFARTMAARRKTEIYIYEVDPAKYRREGGLKAHWATAHPGGWRMERPRPNPRRRGGNPLTAAESRTLLRGAVRDVRYARRMSPGSRTRSYQAGAAVGKLTAIRGYGPGRFPRRSVDAVGRAATRAALGNPVPKRPPWRDGQRIPVEKARAWVVASGNRELLKQFDDAVRLQTKANRKPRHVVWRLLQIGDPKRLESVTAMAEYGKAYETLYKPPKGSKKGKSHFKHSWGEGRRGSRPVPLLAAPGGKALILPLGKGQTAGDWLRG